MDTNRRLIVRITGIFSSKRGVMSTISMNIRMDSEVKKQAQELFAALGMDMTTACSLKMIIFNRKMLYRVLSIL